MLPVDLKTPQEVQAELAARFKARRLAMNLTQEGLAARSGVSWGSLKRFERTGLVALDALLRIAHALDCLGDFDRLCADDKRAFETATLDDILAQAQAATERPVEVSTAPVELLNVFLDAGGCRKVGKNTG